MNKRLHVFGFELKRRHLLAATCLAFALPVAAQSTSDGPPGLPPGLPPITLPSTAPDAAAPAATNTAQAPAQAPSPVALSDLPVLTPLPATPAVGSVALTEKPPAMNALADLPPAPESTEQSITKAPATKAAAATPAPANLPAPGAPSSPLTMAAASPAPPALPSIPGLPSITPIPAGAPNMTPVPNGVAPLSLPAPPGSDTLAGSTVALPEVNVTGDKPKQHTWQTVLAPTAEPMHSRFNYRRVMLPGSIYSTHYADWNEHLPTALTRQDYERMLFTSVSQNDVNTVRALLNAGTDINSRNAQGDTPLAVARRSGAAGAAGLLMARGGH